MISDLPDPDALVQNLVLRTFDTDTVRFGSLISFESSGKLAIHGAFAIPHDLRLKLSQLSLWDEHPITNCIRAGKALEFETIVDKHFDQNQTPSFTLVSPIIIRGIPQGCLVLNFAGKSQRSALAEEVENLTGVLSLYLHIVRQSAPEDAATHDTDTRIATTYLDRFSDRQKNILKLSINGKTNSSIAKELGYSSSTIHQDLMLAYKLLNVHSKREAVAKAQQVGLI